MTSIFLIIFWVVCDPMSPKWQELKTEKVVPVYNYHFKNGETVKYISGYSITK